MKRKFFSVLLALVLVLSFSLVTAVPAAAQATLNVVPFTFTQVSSGTAAWSDAEYHTGSYSVKLYAPASTGGYGQVAMDLDMAFADLADFSVWVEGGETAQALPLLIIEFAEATLPTSVDLSGGNNHPGGETVDLSGSTRVNISSQPGQSEELSDTLMSDAIDGWEKYGTHDDATIDAGTGAYWTIYDYDTGPYDYFTWAEIQTIFAGATVTEVKVQLRYPQAPAAVDSTVYVDDITINDVTYYGKIQDAIDSATATTINVAAGTYTENLDIDKALTLNGANVGVNAVTGTRVAESIIHADAASAVRIAVAGDVTFQGFTVQGWTQNGVFQSYGFGPTAAEHGVAKILDNIVTGPVEATQTGVSIQVMGDDSEVKRNLVDGSINTSVWEGAGIQVLCGDDVVIEYNQVYSADTAISVFGLGEAVVGTIIRYNTVETSVRGIRVDAYTGAVTDTTIAFNVVDGNEIGIESCSDGILPSGTVANYNNIVNNDIGVQSVYGDSGVAEGLEAVDAKFNWWGGVAGPQHSTNPYNAEAATAGNDSVSNDVDFLPWMIHTELVSGWNIYSTPIAPGAVSNTMEKALDLWGSGTDNYTIGYYFNGATQAWVQVLGTTALQPMQAVYLNMSANATIDVVVSAEYTSPPQAVMSAGWNLIGPSALEPMHVDVALLSAKFGAGAPDLWGYSQVHSPALHQTLWTFQRVDAYVDEDFVPTEGYWVHMVNAGLLAGFTSTPIEP